MSIDMTTVQERIGFFTSSEIVALTAEGKKKGTWGKPALTYIEEKRFERRLGRSLDNEIDTRPTSWGNLIEQVLATILDDYIFSSKDTMVHPEVDNWSGTPDGFKRSMDAVFDLKAPATLKSFCQLVQPLYDGLTGIDAINKVRDTHKDAEKYYWQLVSNACLSGMKYAELIVYCPYESELAAIQHAANISGNPKYQWIAFAEKNQLPYIKDDGYYNNLNFISFEVPIEDKIKLTELVIKAGLLL